MVGGGPGGADSPCGREAPVGSMSEIRAVSMGVGPCSRVCPNPFPTAGPPKPMSSGGAASDSSTASTKASREASQLGCVHRQTPRCMGASKTHPCPELHCVHTVCAEVGMASWTVVTAEHVWHSHCSAHPMIFRLTGSCMASGDHVMRRSCRRRNSGGPDS